MLETYTKFDPQTIDLVRVQALAKLVHWCNELNVEIKTVRFFQSGFQILFEGLEGDAVIHDNSYGQRQGLWETYKFPWDEDDVSVHSPKTLACMIAALKKGEDWSQYATIDISH